MKFFFKKQVESKNGSEKAAPVVPETLGEFAAVHTDDEIAAVIALAVNMYVTRMQEYENTIITIQKVIKPYSPWSSKIYGLRQRPVCFHSQRPRIK